MKKWIIIACLLFTCCIITGCGDYSTTNRNSYRSHYSDLINQRGEPREVITIGTNGAFFNYSPLPIEEALQQERDNPFVHNVYEVDNQGYVYP
ncbi:MAG: hypothetical protein OEV87_09325 [Phycisphaerae bacterium]|nr:hypothetical protein [Phycisphaerae bacterium]